MIACKKSNARGEASVAEKHLELLRSVLMPARNSRAAQVNFLLINCY
jgi:hypothetical protein